MAFGWRDIPWLGKIATTPAAGGGGGGASFSDNFNRADAGTLGGNWTTINQAVGIASNEANSANTFDFSERAAVYTATSCSTANQYIKVTFTANTQGTTKPGVVFRYTDGTSPLYEIRFDLANQWIDWERLATPGGAETQVGTVNFGTTLSPALTVGVTCIGTGTSTVIRAWNNPTANAPDSGGTTWDSASPTWTLTNDPASPVDTGTKLGIGGIGSSGALAWDNFYGGDVP